MQAGHICELDSDVLDDIELLLLRAHGLPSAHCALRSTDDRSDDEDDKEKI